jgi:hypothetical protein
MPGSFPIIFVAAIGVTASLAARTSSASIENVREDFTAFAVNLNSGPTTATVHIRIERWSTDQEREELLDILRADGSATSVNRRLARALRRMPRAGFIRTPGSLAWHLRYARQQPLEDGRQIVVATDRPIGFWEARHQPRTIDYPFALLELRLDADSRGEGRMLANTRILIDPRTDNLVLEHFERQPVRLNRIRPR